MSLWRKPPHLSRLYIIDEIQRQEKHLKNLDSIKSTFSSTFSRRRISPKKPNRHLVAKYYALPVPLGIRPDQLFNKENKKMYNRIATAKPSISSRIFSDIHRNEKGYRENILRTKFKHPDYTEQARHCLERRKPKINFKKLYRLERKSKGLERCSSTPLGGWISNK